MAIYQIDEQCSIPEPFGFSGRYYFTWVFYVDAPNDAVAGLRALSDGGNLTDGCNTPTVQWHGYRVTQPPRSGNVIWNTLTLTQHGHRPAGVLCPIENVMRVRMWAGDKQVGYRLWRGGFLMTDLDGQNWLEATRHSVEAVQRTLLGSGIACGLRGDLLTDITVDSRIAMANLRHGTKRRARPVLT